MVSILRGYHDSCGELSDTEKVFDSYDEYTKQPLMY